jgi:hypothetical protein
MYRKVLLEEYENKKKAVMFFRKFCLMGYNASYSVESQPTFRRNMSSHLQARNISLGRNQRESRWRHVPQKRPLAINGLHGVVFQKIEFFITTAVRTSNLTCYFKISLAI